ncbi:hypothetical protein AYI69_g834, partial [Smittium culicis]
MFRSSEESPKYVHPPPHH